MVSGRDPAIFKRYILRLSHCIAQYQIGFETPPSYGEWEDQDDKYFIRSTVLGGAVVSEVGHTGKKKQTFVYAGGAKIARQTRFQQLS